MIAAILDHLWQSTLFALAAGLLAVALRRHSAGVRYGLWFAASIKFLIPFAVLTAAGGALASRLHLTLIAPHEAAALGAASAPLDWAPQMMAPASAFHALPAAHAAAPAHLLPAFRFDPAPMLVGVWALGVAAILTIWAVRWSRIRAALSAATPMDLPAPIPVLSLPAGLEPGVVGLFRPVVLLPEGIAERLPPAELEAILAHELRHVRRRDNLTAAIHMLVQALFWFHPLVWWMGQRLVAERERACDEGVVRAGHDRETYARGIIETCRLYLQSSLACVAGASGSSLTMRVDDILSRPPAAPLPLEAKSAIGLAGALALAIPVGAGLLTAPQIAQPLIAQPLIAKPLAVLAQAAHVAPLLKPAPPAVQSTAARA
jgi:beta-lactamase regulating signal transducer with metallopeptidase domain